MTEPTQESLWPSRWLRPDLMKVLIDCQGAAARVLVDAPAAINQYLERLERAASANEFLDVTLGRRLANTALILSADVGRLDPLQQQWLGCAIAYLIDADDATHDLVALDGLDDCLTTTRIAGQRQLGLPVVSLLGVSDDIFHWACNLPFKPIVCGNKITWRLQS